MRRAQAFVLAAVLVLIIATGWLLFGPSTPVFIRHDGIVEMGTGQQDACIRLYYRYPALRVADFAWQSVFVPDPAGGEPAATYYVSFVGEETEHLANVTVVNQGVSLSPLRCLELWFRADAACRATVAGIKFATDAGEIVCPIGSITVIANEGQIFSPSGYGAYVVVSAGDTDSATGLTRLPVDAPISTATTLPTGLGTVTWLDGSAVPDPSGREVLINLTRTPTSTDEPTCLIYHPLVTVASPSAGMMRFAGPVVELISNSGVPAGLNRYLLTVKFAPGFRRQVVGVLFGIGSLAAILAICYVWQIGMRRIALTKALDGVATLAGILFALLGVASVIVLLTLLGSDQALGQLICLGGAGVSALALRGLSAYFARHKSQE